jgi:EAL and modified HD-GYP domain-containing signal transduction protein
LDDQVRNPAPNQSSKIAEKGPRSAQVGWRGADTRGVQPVQRPAAVWTQVHIGRQAVYDDRSQIFGYELLFRAVAEAAHASHNGSYATSQVIINAFTEFGLDQLVGDRLCLLNLTRDFVTGDLPLPFLPGQVVLEVLETVQIDDAAVAGVRRLAGAGFPIALDDFVLGTPAEQLLDLADFVKLDILEASFDHFRAAVELCRRYPRIRVIAERIETPAQLSAARSLGVDLFQGYGLERPKTLSTGTLSPSRLRRLELFGSLNEPDIDFARVVSIVAEDPALSFQVLRASNSAAAGLTRRVSSVREAVFLLGIARVRQWVALMLMTDVAQASENQLNGVMARARMCQTVTDRMGLPGDAGFLVGLLAGVSDLIGLTPGELANRLPLTEAVRAALLSGSGGLGAALAIVRGYESQDGEALSGSPVDAGELARHYLDAVTWSNRTVDAVVGRG